MATLNATAVLLLGMHEGTFDLCGQGIYPAQCTHTGTLAMPCHNWEALGYELSGTPASFAATTLTHGHAWCDLKYMLRAFTHVAHASMHGLTAPASAARRVSTMGAASSPRHPYTAPKKIATEEQGVRDHGQLNPASPDVTAQEWGHVQRSCAKTVPPRNQAHEAGGLGCASRHIHACSLEHKEDVTLQGCGAQQRAECVLNW